MKIVRFHGPAVLLTLVTVLSFLLPGNSKANNPEEQFFSLNCPPDVTISCEDDLYDLDKYGKAYVHDYSGTRPAKKPKVERSLNSCGKGTIVRTWTEEDYHWNIHQCSQTIYVTGGGLTQDDIIWPENYELEGCHPDTDPRQLPKENGYPRYKSTDCAEPMASYKDEVFEFSKTCKKVIRKWTVIDWCEYKPNKRPLPGYFTHYQVIKVSAADKPIIECPKDSVYKANKSCDSTLVELDSVLAYTTCDSNLTIRNNSPYAFDDGPDATGIYPVGTTKVTFTIEYGCGKDTSCSVLVTVEPAIGPVAYCRNGVITTLMGVDTNDDGRFDDGMVELWAKDLDIGSYHPCGNLPVFFSFSADSIVMTRTFTCADLGENEVRIYISDGQGNQVYCRTKITIQNNNSNIPDCERDTTGGGGGTTTGPILTYSTLLGDVVTDKGRAVPNAEITLIAYGQDTILTSKYDTVISARLDTIILPNGVTRVEVVIDTTVVVTNDTTYGDLVSSEFTDNAGSYTFGKWLNGSKYYVSAEKTSPKIREGIDVLDALLLIQHLIGAATIETPYRLIAADVNGDGILDYTDFEILYDVVMGVRTSFPDNRNWTFVPSDHQFSDPNNPWLDPWSDLVTVDPLQNNTNIDYIGIKIGDLDGTVRPTMTSTVTQTRNTASWPIDLTDESIKSGESFTLTIPLDELLAGVIQLHIPSSVQYLGHSFPGASIAGINKVIVDGSVLKIGFSEVNTLELSFLAMEDIRIRSEFDKSLWSGDLYSGERVAYRPVPRFLDNKEHAIYATAYPNPFTDVIRLDLFNLEAGEMDVHVFDMTGKRIVRKTFNITSGKYSISLGSEELRGAGMYFYEILNGHQRIQGKMQMIK